MLKLENRSGTISLALDRVEMIIENESDVTFLMQSKDNPRFKFTVRYPLPVEMGYNVEDFKIHPFISPVHNKENNIYQVNHKKIGKSGSYRIGWIFTIQALLSREHNEANNPHFLKYALVTFEKLLRGELYSKDHVVYVDNFDGEITLEDLYPPDLAIFTLSKLAFHPINEFDINNYLQSFYILDYLFCQSGQDYQKLAAVGENSLELKSSITINEISDDLKDVDYPTDLFTTYLKIDEHPFVQFSLLYQIIELLIEKVYEFEITKHFLDARIKPYAPHDIKKKMEGLSNMDFRIKLLFSGYLQRPLSSTKEFENAVHFFLKKFDIEKVESSDSIGMLIYSCRNRIVHDIRKITRSDYTFAELRQVNKYFAKLIAEVLILFSKFGSRKQDEDEYSDKPIEWLKYKLLIEQGHLI